MLWKENLFLKKHFNAEVCVTVKSGRPSCIGLFHQLLSPSFLSLFFILIFFSMADANPLQFSDPKSVPETALFSFHPLFYLYFILSFLLVPYLLYRWIASKYKWELNSKSVGRHCSDLLLGMSYGLILFTFGNYTHTYRFIRAWME